MEITVISTETIKPSSPTPRHLKHLKLSLIDQFTPATFYTRILLFYSAQGDVHRFHNTNMSHRFKNSLSEVLTKLYPLAGRFDNLNHSIECNDDGLEYTEARVKSPLTLSQVLACPKPEELDQLQPSDACNYGSGFKGLSAVQVTVFEECGGMAIGVSLSHILADAASLAVFITTWAEILRREDEDKTVAAVFNSASLFPPRDVPAQGDSGMAKRFVVKRFVFSQLNIDRLKAKFRYQRPTRVEVVSALLLKCQINMSKTKTSGSLLPGIAVNLRSRMSPPSSVHIFGNMALTLIMKQYSSESESERLNDLGVELRKMIKEIDIEYVKMLQANDASLLYEYLDHQTKVYGEGRALGVTSWCKFPFYGVDVGWGVPAWVASVQPTWEDCIVLIDAKNGDGIEAWASLDKDDMAIFESDNELLEFASPNPMV